MRASTADLEAVLNAPSGYATWTRVWVADFNDALVDLSTFGNVNFVQSVTYQDDVDGNGQTATIMLSRESYDLSLSPLREDSPLNKALAWPGIYAPLLQLRRRIKIEVACLADGERPTTQWINVFEGQIDLIDFADPTMIRLDCRDQVAPILDTMIRSERVYAYDDGLPSGTASYGLRVWEAGETYAVGDKVIPQQGKRNGKYYNVTVAGVSAATEPVWPSVSSAPFNSGTVTMVLFGNTTEGGRPIESIVRALLDDHGLAAVQLQGTWPTWFLRPWQQTRTSVWEAIKALVDQTGYSIRYEWGTTGSVFKLTIRLPDRIKTIADRFFSVNRILSFTQMSLSLHGIRNVIAVKYSDSIDKDTNRQPKRKTWLVTDTFSVGNYGARFLEIAESDTSQIDSTAEASRLAEAVRDDLAQPDVEFGVEVLYNPLVQLGDLYDFEPDGIRFSSQLRGAVIGYVHDLTPTSSRTKLQLRGKPSAGYTRWLAKDTRIRAKDSHVNALANAWGIATITAKPTVGGVKLQYGSDESKLSNGTQLEVHLSKTQGFAVTNQTLAWQGFTKTATLSELEPGERYYARFVPKSTNDERIVTAQPSDEISFVAGRALAGHLNPQVGYGYFPPNPSFEHQSRDPAVQMPDHWECAPGTVYGVDVDSFIDPQRGRSIRYKGTANICRFQSALFPIQQGSRFGRVVLNKSLAGNAAVIRLRVQFWIDDVTASSTPEQVIDFNTAGAAFWRGFVDQPVDANFARLVIEKAPAQPASNLVLYSVYYESGVAAGVGFEALVGQNSWSPSVRAVVYPGAHGMLVFTGQLTKATAPTANEVMANLPTITGVAPSSYCESETRRFVVPNGSGLGVIETTQTQIRYVSGGAGTYWLDGVSFPYRALWPFN